MKIKICGMKYYDNIKDVAAFYPDYLGFIFYKKSSRYFNGKIPNLHSSIKKVGVFVDSSIEDVLNHILKYRLDAVQLHGNESVDFCNELKLKSLSVFQNNVQIIKVFSIDTDFEFESLKSHEECCDFFLFDTKGPLPGGNGYTFDWTLLKKNHSNKPFFLSGGIGIDNIKHLEEFLQSEVSKNCFAIDMNSKLEIEAGLKSPELVKKIMIAINTIKQNGQEF